MQAYMYNLMQTLTDLGPPKCVRHLTVKFNFCDISKLIENESRLFINFTIITCPINLNLVYGYHLTLLKYQRCR